MYLDHNYSYFLNSHGKIMGLNREFIMVVRFYLQVELEVEKKDLFVMCTLSS